MIIGIDEAGRGALAGPVVAGAVAFKSDLTAKNCAVFSFIKDSKQLTDKQRREAAVWLKQNVWWGVGFSSSQQIDQLGIKPANHQAMQTAVTQLLSHLPQVPADLKLLIDGRDKFLFAYPSEDIVKGDEKVLEISAASILAKVARDDYMMALHDKFPKFGFAAHKGYGAKAHYQMLEAGVHCPEHRQSYDPLKTWLTQGRLF